MLRSGGGVDGSTVVGTATGSCCATGSCAAGSVILITVGGGSSSSSCRCSSVVESTRMNIGDIG